MDVPADRSVPDEAATVAERSSETDDERPPPSHDTEAETESAGNDV